ncbi:MAG: DsbA family protein [bacterium]|nr:DsbA family protein [bacterium]
MTTRTLLGLSIVLLVGCTSSDLSKKDIVIHDYAILGNADAPVTLVEYSDYQCPFCRKFTTEVLPQIKKEYIDTGMVRLVFKDYPLHIHDAAIEAAIATHCAGKQDAYYAYHDMLFENSRDISTKALARWAEVLQLDTNAFATCLEDPAIADIVYNSITEAKSHGVIGTPSFLLNGKYIAGARPFSYFDREIQSALNKKVVQPKALAEAVCSNDVDCGEARSFPPYCSQTSDAVCITSASPSCTYGGTEESACVTMIKEECTLCEEGVCSEGECA